MEQRVAVVVEDDEDIRALLAEILGQSGFIVHQAGTGADGVAAVREHEPVVVTVDLGLPDFDGYEVTRRVRTFSDAYVVMLTARAEEIDTLMGLESGADDYLTKPFRPRELRARVEAMLRRPRTLGGVPRHAAHGGTPGHAVPGHAVPGHAVPGHAVPDYAGPRSAAHASSPHAAPAGGAAADAGSWTPSAGNDRSPLDRTADWPLSPPVRQSTATAAYPSAVSGSVPSAAAPHEDPAARNRLALDDLALYPSLHRVVASGREIPLTPTEFVLLETLLRGGQVVRSKAELARIVRGDLPGGGAYVSTADERAVEVHVGNLRRKLGDASQRPRWIQTVRGVGYRMAGRPTVTG